MNFSVRRWAAPVISGPGAMALRNFTRPPLKPPRTDEGLHDRRRFRIGLRVVPAGGLAADQHDRRRRAVVDRRGHADRGSGVRRRSRRCEPAVHAAHGRLRGGRRADGQAHRPLRHCRALVDRGRGARRRLYARRVVDDAVAVRPRPPRAGRLPRQLRDLRAGDRRRLALVRPPPRHRRRRRLLRQLPRRNGLAAGDPAFRRDRRMARHPSRHRPLLPRHHSAARAPHPAEGAGRRRGEGFTARARGRPTSTA